MLLYKVSKLFACFFFLPLETFSNGGRDRKWFSVPEAIKILIERGKHSKVTYFAQLDKTATDQSNSSVSDQPLLNGLVKNGTDKLNRFNGEESNDLSTCSSLSHDPNSNSDKTNEPIVLEVCQ